MLEEAHGKAVVKKRRRFMSCINVFVVAVRVSVTIRAASDRHLQQMTTLSVCTKLFEVTDERVFISGSKNISWKRSQYS
jgi:hypothetical protein